LSRGRKACGSRVVEDLEVPATARRQLHAVLAQTFEGMPVEEACRVSGLSRTVFFEKKQEAYEAMAKSFQPPEPHPAEVELAKLRQAYEAVLAQNREMKHEIEVMRVQIVLGRSIPEALTEVKKKWGRKYRAPRASSPAALGTAKGGASSAAESPASPAAASASSAQLLPPAGREGKREGGPEAGGGIRPLEEALRGDDPPVREGAPPAPDDPRLLGPGMERSEEEKRPIPGPAHPAGPAG
jgi:hypothetical protein